MCSLRDTRLVRSHTVVGIDDACTQSIGVKWWGNQHWSRAKSDWYTFRNGSLTMRSRILIMAAATALSVGLGPRLLASATTAHPSYPLGRGAHCRANYRSVVREHKVKGSEVHFRECVYRAPTTILPTMLPPAGMHLVFSDDFSGSVLDTATWQTCYWWVTNGAGCTNYGNSDMPEYEWYLPSQDQVSNGVLHLVASETPTLGTNANGDPETYPWTSGMVTTQKSFEFTYGFVEVSAQIANGNGMWCALWLGPASEAGVPEVDIAETWGAGTASTWLGFYLHLPGGVRPSRQIHTKSLMTGWHTFAVDWEPSSLTWYVDGVKMFTYTGSGIPQVPMYFLANLAVYKNLDMPQTAAMEATDSFNIRSVQIYQR